MAYTKRYAGGFLDKPTLTTPIDSAFLNAVETALLALLTVDGTVDGQVLQWVNASTRFGPALLLNKNVDAAAAIDWTKINTAGQITNAAVAGAAAIARSKLDFGSGLANADIAAAAAIAASKLANYPTDGTKALLGDGTWGPVGVTVATTVAGLGTGSAGKTGLLRLGVSPYTYLALTFDTTYNKWVSEEDTVPLQQAPRTTTTQTDVLVATEINATYTNEKRPWKVFTDAGLTLQLKWSLLQSISSTKVSFSDPSVAGLNAGGVWSAYTEVPACLVSTNNTTSPGILLSSGWQNLTVGTPADYINFHAMGYRSSGGTPYSGIYSEMIVETRWVA